jgi:peptide/nickel transport system substrate-binding protein
LGAFIEAAAFDGHVLGRPKVDRIRMLWNQDPSAVLGHLLSGEAHLAIDLALPLSEGLVLRREWAARGAGEVIFLHRSIQQLDFQHRAEYVTPRALLDVRVRRALAHAIDKATINDNVLEGFGAVADSMIHPTAPYFSELDRAIQKYPFDPRRSEALMQDAGYAKGPDGWYTSPTEGRLTFQIRAAPQAAPHRAAVAAGWREAGFETEEVIATGGAEGNATFRTVNMVGGPIGLDDLSFFTSSGIARADIGWVGANRGGWSNPEYDRLVETVGTTIDRTQRAQVIIAAVRVITDQLGSLQLYFLPAPIPAPSGLTGPNARTPEADLTWNVHEWEFH